MTAPYYEDDNATLYHGDCNDILPDLGRHDLLVTDPPYGVEFQSNRRIEAFAEMVGDDDPDAVVATLGTTIKANLERNRHAYVFGPFDLTPLVDAGLVQEPVELIWDKDILGMGNLKLPWATQHEAIQFMVAVKSKSNVKDGAGRLTARMRRGSILTYPRPHAAAVKRHPVEKPVGLLRELIESSSVMGETVLDPFAGCGSTLVAAVLEGRKAVGIEIDEGYCEAAAKRLLKVSEHLREVA